VVGLGDGYNDETATVDDATTTRTVVGQVAAYFGQSNIESRAEGEKRIRDLSGQIGAVTGGFSSGDLVVITVGTFDVIAGADPATEAQTLVTQVQSLKNAGVKHILIMPVLDVSRTPWGRANSNLVSTTATNTFNTAVLSALSSAFGGQSPNTVIYANATGVTSLFLTATSTTTFSPFTDTGYNGTVAGTTPACGDPTVFTGCPSSVPTAASRNYTTMLFADGIHLTPAGNRWVAGYLYNATHQGWR
jgi:phospholipase/lecithinase/hemolysin